MKFLQVSSLFFLLESPIYSLRKLNKDTAFLYFCQNWWNIYLIKRLKWHFWKTFFKKNKPGEVDTKHSAKRETVKCFFFFSFCVLNILNLYFPLQTTANKLYTLPVSVYPDITVWALINLLHVKIWRSSGIYKTEGGRSNIPVGKLLVTNRWSVFPVGRNFKGLFLIMLIGWHQSPVWSLMTTTLMKSSNQH